MIEIPIILPSEGLQTAALHLTIPREEIQKVMGPAIGEVMAAVSAQGISPAGPVFSHHLRMEPDTFDFKVGVPVSSPLTAVGRVEPGELPSRKVAKTVYHGPYEGLGAAWGELDAWIAANGHTADADLWEFYAAGPETSPNPSDWRTELFRPLLS